MKIKEPIKKYIEELQNNNPKYVFPSIAVMVISLIIAVFCEPVPVVFRGIATCITIALSFILFMFTGRE